jgi:hypothetical protein
MSILKSLKNMTGAAALDALTALFTALVEQFGREAILAVVRDVAEVDIEGVRESEELF